MKPPKVSVVIATYGREKVLCDTLEQVLEEDYADFEVIVVDQSASHEAETASYLREIEGQIRYLLLPEPNLTRAENVGIREATGEVVLFLDDDVQINKGLIAAHAANYSDDQVAGVAGMVTHDDRPPTRSLPRICTFSRAGWLFFIHNYSRRVWVKVAPGGNMSFRREALMSAGGVDESLVENAMHWETDLCARARARGGRIVHDPRARVHHLRAPRGGARMGRVLPRSFFSNYIRAIWRHVPRHERAVAVWRLWRDHVLIGSGGRPDVFGTMFWRMMCELVKVARRGPGEPLLGLSGGRVD